MSMIRVRADNAAPEVAAEASPMPAGRERWPDSERIWPGLLLVLWIAVAAFALRQVPVLSTFSAPFLAIILGIALHNSVGTPRHAHAGVAFSLRRVLRLAIILLGLQITAAQIATIGMSGVLIIVATLIATFAFTQWVGALIGVDRKLAQLIAAGTSICGASAVIATNTMTGARDEDVAYAVACVTVFGSIAMFVYPVLPGVLHLDTQAYGLWAGASIHEIAQVVAASFQDGPRAGQIATIAKLSRVMLLAPMVIALGFHAARRQRLADGQAGRKPPMPWFVLGFVALVIVNSVVEMPVQPRALLIQLTTFLLTMALAAMGLETDLGKLQAKGLKPLLLGAASWLFIAGLSLALVWLAGQGRATDI
jgi:uncharacterized integral membrane protein (TIGR00698 family)